MDRSYIIQFKWIEQQYRKWILEVDLEYPKDLYELHNDYILGPDEMEIKKEMLSKYLLKMIFLIFLLVF